VSIRDADGAKRHTGEAAIGIIKPARYRQHPVAGRPAAHRFADVHAAIPVFQVILKVLAIGIVVCQRTVLRRHQPAAVGAKHEQRMQLLDLRCHILQMQLQPGTFSAAVSPIGFHAFDHAGEHGIDHAHSALALGRERVRHIGRGHGHFGQTFLARTPAVRDLDRQQ
jgi:hypothetical protein